MNQEYSVLKRQDVRMLSSLIFSVIRYFFHFRKLSIFQAQTALKPLSKPNFGSPFKSCKSLFFISLFTEQISILYQRVHFSSFCLVLFYLSFLSKLNSNEHNCFFRFTICVSLSQSNTDCEFRAGSKGPNFQMLWRTGSVIQIFLEWLRDADVPLAPETVQVIADKVDRGGQGKSGLLSSWKPECSSNVKTSWFQNWVLNK